MTSKPIKGSPASAQPMPGLSKRAQQQLAPVRASFCTPIPKSYRGEIPQAFRSSFSAASAQTVEGASVLCAGAYGLSVRQRTEVA